MVPANKPSPDISGKSTHKTVPGAQTEHWIETLRDGTRVLIRPLRPEDRAAEGRFIRNLSPQARRFRFLGDFKEPGQALLDPLMETGAPRSAAFVALLHDDGPLREIGVDRHAAGANGKTCECAVTVADGWRRRGLGTLLMCHLIAAARTNGMARMFSIDDPAMRELADHPGFRCGATQHDAHSVTCTLDL